jgi:lysyl-tRNA synthetase class 2
LEFYQAYATYQDLMELTETLFRSVAMEVLGSTSFTYKGTDIHLDGSWQRITLSQALKTHAGIEADMLNDTQALLNFADKKKVKLTKTNRPGKIITKLFDALVEPKLIQPTFITGYPVEVSPLSRRSDQQPEITERFELFISGFEIANGFSELNDPEDQHARFLQQVMERQAGNEEAHLMDEDYIEALEYGMPPTAGEGIGIDRMAMLLTDAASIREVILFPHMKPKPN